MVLELCKSVNIGLLSHEKQASPVWPGLSNTDKVYHIGNTCFDLWAFNYKKYEVYALPSYARQWCWTSRDNVLEDVQNVGKDLNVFVQLAQEGICFTKYIGSLKYAPQWNCLTLRKTHLEWSFTPGGRRQSILPWRKTGSLTLRASFVSRWIHWIRFLCWSD